jgi:MFS family permease
VRSVARWAVSSACATVTWPARAAATSGRDEKLRSTAQGILSMVGSGLAGILSNLTAGWLVDRSGTDMLYLLCGIGSLTLGVFSYWILPFVERRREEPKEIALASETLT